MMASWRSSPRELWEDEVVVETRSESEEELRGWPGVCKESVDVVS